MHTKGMGIFSKFKHKNTGAHNIPSYPVTTDIHSHLIPGVDDGSQSMDESIELIKELGNIGIKKIISTPHISGDMYPNTSGDLKKGWEEVRSEIAKQKIDIDFQLAAEYYVDENLMEIIEKDDILYFGDKYVLLETNFINQTTKLFNKVVFDLQLKGYKAVLAHPERYTYLWNSFALYEELKAKDIFFQINIGSLVNFYSPQAKNAAAKLIEHNLVDMIGTDLHRIEHMEAIHTSLNSPYMQKIHALNLLNNAL
jgi:protein-tyrosine phosphatase